VIKSVPLLSPDYFFTVPCHATNLFLDGFAGVGVASLGCEDDNEAFLAKGRDTDECVDTARKS
jgi:hypothetical protein